ncbi:hypothetical protein ABMA58_07185, partial [Oceanospirillum sp. HFRX-1_2]
MTTDSTGTFIPAPASLDNPFYYLINARQVIDWCLLHYADLLLDDEIHLLEKLLALPENAQGLLIRLIMRKGDLFRDDSLNYPEVGYGTKLRRASEQLQASDLIDLCPRVSLPELTHLCRKPEALALLQYCHRRYSPPQIRPIAKHSKQDLLAFAEAVSDYLPEDERQQTLFDWWPAAAFQLMQLRCGPLFERLRLMFFGNLYQNWSEFVLAELGIQKYEHVAFTPESRAFRHRQEVDIYLELYRVQQQLEIIKIKPEGSVSDPLKALVRSLERLALSHQNYLSDSGLQASQWLQRRYQKTLFQLGHFAERLGFTELALCCYEKSQVDDAVIRRFRLMEKLADNDRDYGILFDEATSAFKLTDKPEQKLLLNRVLNRVARKLNKTVKSNKKVRLTEQHLTLQPDANRSVEPVLIDHLAEQG